MAPPVCEADGAVRTIGQVLAEPGKILSSERGPVNRWAWKLRKNFHLSENSRSERGGKGDSMDQNTNAKTVPLSAQRLSKKTLFAYGCGDFASNLTNTFIGSYLSIYYTDVVGLAPIIVSVIMIIARIWDAINDPMFGGIAERTNSKRGRFRPYIFYFTPFLALSAVLTFTTIGGSGAAIYAAITYIAYGMLYTVVNLSYGSLSTVMTTNPEDMSLLTSWRMMGTNLSSVILSALSPVILKALSGSDQFTGRSYTITILIYALCQVPLFYFVYANCKEVVKPINDGVKVPVSQSLKAVLTNKPLMLISP